MSRGDGYSSDPRAYGLPLEDWDRSAKGRALLAEMDRVNAPRKGETLAEADYFNDPMRKDP